MNNLSARRKKQVWEVGSIFLVPLQDGGSCPGQVVGRERELMDSAAVLLFDLRGQWQDAAELPPLLERDVFAKLLVSRQSLDSGQWRVIGRAEPVLGQAQLPHESTRASGFVGAKVRGCDIVQEFVSAFYGLVPWDDWYVPDYLDDLLVSAERKPVERLTYSGRHPR